MRELPAGHGERAVVEIDAEHMLGRMVELAEGTHELGEREIAETRLGLRAGDALVDDDGIVARQEADELHDLADRLLRLVPGQKHVRDRDGAGIDEGIARFALLALELDDGVERSAGWLAADPVPQPVADHAERERQREHLGDALDGEGGIGLAGHVLLPVHRRDGDAEMPDIDGGELGNVVGDLAALGMRGDFTVDVVHQRLQIVHQRSPSAG